MYRKKLTLNLLLKYVFKLPKKIRAVHMAIDLYTRNTIDLKQNMIIKYSDAKRN